MLLQLLVDEAHLIPYRYFDYKEHNVVGAADSSNEAVATWRIERAVYFSILSYCYIKILKLLKQELNLIYFKVAKNQENATHLLKSKLQNRPHNATKPLDRNLRLW